MNTILGVAGVVAALAVIVVAILWTMMRQERLTTIRTTPRAVGADIPPIDAAAPDRVETATFALG
jgi:hypothetical protein